MSTTISTDWRCPLCRAVGTVDVRADATTAERDAFIAAAHHVVQPRCNGIPEIPSISPETSPKSRAKKGLVPVKNAVFPTGKRTESAHATSRDVKRLAAVIADSSASNRAHRNALDELAAIAEDEETPARVRIEAVETIAREAFA
jgi:hypothetical protein